MPKLLMKTTIMKNNWNWIFTELNPDILWTIVLQHCSRSEDMICFWDKRKPSPMGNQFNSLSPHIVMTHTHCKFRRPYHEIISIRNYFFRAWYCTNFPFDQSHNVVQSSQTGAMKWFTLVIMSYQKDLKILHVANTLRRLFTARNVLPGIGPK